MVVVKMERFWSLASCQQLKLFSLQAEVQTVALVVLGTARAAVYSCTLLVFVTQA